MPGWQLYFSNKKPTIHSQLQSITMSILPLFSKGKHYCCGFIYANVPDNDDKETLENFPDILWA